MPESNDAFDRDFVTRGHTPLTTRLSALLTFWTLLGLAGCGEVVYCGLTNDWIGFLIGLTYTLLAIFMLGSGLWMRAAR